MKDSIVIGGGLAGLIAANIAARAGLSVTVVEKSKSLGGRARSAVRDQFIFNQGPHALYIRGNLARTLSDLGIKVTGKKGAPRGTYIGRESEFASMPTNVLGLLTHPWFSRKGRVDMIRFYGRAIMGRMNGSALAFELDQIKDAKAKGFASSLVRLSTYNAEPERIVAHAAADQLKLATGGVLYLDGGWQTIVDGLENSARALGVEFLTGQKVEQIESSRDEVRLHTTDRIIESRTAILAADPESENAWLGTKIGSGKKLRAACLDVALDRLPEPDHIFAQDIAEPLYLSVHSASANLGPGQVIHVARYLKEGEEAGEGTKKQLRDFLARFQPGSEDRIVQERFLPDMIVAHDFQDTTEQPGVEIDSAKPLFRAGDWVRGSGMLSDRSAFTAVAAAEKAMARIRAKS